MTILYGAAQGMQAMRSEAMAIHHAKTRRYFLKQGDLYLFWDGSKLTDNRQHAWTGTGEQGRACRAKFPAAAQCRLKLAVAIPQLVNEEV